MPYSPDKNDAADAEAICEAVTRANMRFVATKTPEHKLEVPVLALGVEKSFGTTMAVVMRLAASNVEEGVVPDSGHWIMEENPKATIELVRGFLDKLR